MFRSFAPITALAVLSVSTMANACAPPLVQFAFGSARVPVDGQHEVSLVLHRARTVPHARIKLTATTDGSRPNLEMSRRRVEAVKAVLARGGVPNAKVDVEYVSAIGNASARVVMLEVVSAPTCAG
jgi:outer membrane protein OmpA-like peptidoglycan-associated protein